MDKVQELSKRFQRLFPHQRREPAHLIQLAAGLGLTAVAPRLGERGRFIRFEGMEFELDGQLVFFPLLRPAAIVPARQRAEPWTNIVAQTGWITPSYISMRTIERIRQDLAAAPEDKRAAVLDGWLPRIYEGVGLAAMLTERFPKVPYVKDYLTVIEQAVTTFNLGMTTIAISGLVPVIEGIARRVFQLPERMVGTKLLREFVDTAMDRYAEQLIYLKSWVPLEYREKPFLARVDEYACMLLTFREYSLSHFFADTDHCKDPSRLNRNGITHGLWLDYGRPANFYRLISLLDFLTFVVTMNSSGISCLAPDITYEARRLTAHLHWLKTGGRFAISARGRLLAERLAVLAHERGRLGTPFSQGAGRAGTASRWDLAGGSP